MSDRIDDRASAGPAAVAPAYDAEALLVELAGAVRAYLEQLGTLACVNPTSTDVQVLAARVRRQIDRWVAQAEMQRLAQVAQLACFEHGPAAPRLRELADCVRAYLDARTRERDTTQSVLSGLRAFDDLEVEVTNRIWWERDLLLLAEPIGP